MGMGNVCGHMRENNEALSDIPEWYITKSCHEPVHAAIMTLICAAVLPGRQGCMSHAAHANQTLRHALMPL